MAEIVKINKEITSNENVVIQFASTSDERNKEKYWNAIFWGAIGLVAIIFFITWMVTDLERLGMIS